MKSKSIKTAIIVVISVILLALIYTVLNKIFNDDSNKYSDYLKDYEVNEYIPVYISDEAMAKIYLKEYIDTMYTNVEVAYNLLDEEYRNKKFGSLDEFKNYVNSLNLQVPVMDKYYLHDSDGYEIFGVYTKDNRFYAFKTKGVMQYSVYLDDYTVEIW